VCGVRAAVVVAVALVLAPAASAAPPTVAASASATSGAAPLHVVFSASGDAATYHWSFGDGAVADGATVEHVYGPGAFTAQLTATSAGGERASKTFRIRSIALVLHARSVVGFGQHLRFTGRVLPALHGVRVGVFGPDGRRVASGLTRRGGRFRIGAPVTRPGAYSAKLGVAVSNPVPVRVRPAIVTAFTGSGAVGRPLRLTLGLRPAGGGVLHISVVRDGHPFVTRDLSASGSIRLSTRRPARYRILVSTTPATGYATAQARREKIVFYPRLAVGSNGPSVLALNRELDRIHVALGAVDSTFGLDTRDAVVAFQKLHGLPRTGSVDARLWHLLLRAETPRARYRYGDHIEVSKPLQVLFVVRAGRVVLVSHVSTGATGNTPVGRWHVYLKTRGFLPDGMFDSSFFLRGFALHGYSPVPYYPGSHGCVRIPIWLAPRIFALAPYGSVVDVY
jgi:hypothetical protein